MEPDGMDQTERRFSSTTRRGFQVPRQFSRVYKGLLCHLMPMPPMPFLWFQENLSIGHLEGAACLPTVRNCSYFFLFREFAAGLLQCTRFAPSGGKFATGLDTVLQSALDQAAAVV